jgi:hypothetical protein
LNIKPVVGRKGATEKIKSVMKTKLSSFKNVLFPIRADLDNSCTYSIIRKLFDTIDSSTHIIASVGKTSLGREIVNKEKWVEVSIDLNRLQNDYMHDEPAFEGKVQVDLVCKDYETIVNENLSSGKYDLVIFTLPYTHSDSNLAYVEMIERTLSTKRISVLIVPESSEKIRINKTVIISRFNTLRLDLALEIASFVKTRMNSTSHLLNLLGEAEKSDSVISAHLSRLKSLKDVANVTYSNKHMSLNCLSLDKASSLRPDLIVRIIRDEISDFQLKYDYGGECIFGTTPVLMLFS